MGQRIYNIPVKELLVKKIAEEMELDELLVECIVTDQFKQVNKAMHDNMEVEISGFGKFQKSRKKLERRLERAIGIKGGTENRLKAADTQEEVIRWTKRLDSITQAHDFYKTSLEKLDEV